MVPDPILRPAETLAEIDFTLGDQPLLSRDEQKAFYSAEYEKARGSGQVGQLKFRLGASFGKKPFHAFVLGHPGVGKSTEISRLLLDLQDRYEPIRISAASELYPREIRIQDLLWLMIVRMLEVTTSPAIMGFSYDLSPGLLNDVKREMSETVVKHLGINTAEVEAGISASLLVRIRAAFKIQRERKEETTEYTYSRLSTLLDLVNRVFDECNGYLKNERQLEWVIVAEDFEKLGVDADSLGRLFFDYRLLFEQLTTSLLLVVPVELVYSQDAERMPFGLQRQFMIPDMAVMDRGHEPNADGIGAMLAALELRMVSSLLAPGLAHKLVIASGGNLRTLFDLVARSAINAQIRAGSRIELADAAEAVQDLRFKYKQRLGENSFDRDEALDSETKLTKLYDVYQGQPYSQFADRALYLLLRHRMVLQHNGEGWFGIHPIAVDLLKQAGKLPADAPGGTDF